MLLYQILLSLVSADVALCIEELEFKYDGFNKTRKYRRIPVNKNVALVELSMPNNRIRAINMELQNYPSLEVRCVTIIKTPWHQNAFCITGPLWGEFLGSTHKSSAMRALMIYLFLAWTSCWTNSRRTGDLRHHERQCNVYSISHELWTQVSCALFWFGYNLSIYWTLYSFHPHDDVIKWKHFPRYWPFEQGIHRSPVNSLHKGQWHGALMFSLMCVWINGWVNNREAGDLRRYRAHYDVTGMIFFMVVCWHIARQFWCQWNNPHGHGQYPKLPNHSKENANRLFISLCITLIAMFMGATWGPSWADRTQVGLMLVPWTLLYGKLHPTHICHTIL